MVTRGTRRQERGQALAELVLGLMVFVTVLIFGLHFSELMHLGLKTHEAVAAAAWDATAYRVERPGVVGDGVAYYDTGRIASRVTDTTNERYADWDGRQSAPGGTGPVQAFTRANGLTTTCTRNMGAGNTFDMSGIANTPVYQEPGALSCVSRSTVSTINIPTGFLQKPDKGFFSVQHVPRTTYPVCGLGRSNSGACRGTLSVLLGDHGLTSDFGEEKECEVRDDDVPGQPCTNRAFYNLAHNAWDTSKPWSGLPESFADRVTGSFPPGGKRVTGFYLSFRGESPDNPYNFGDRFESRWQSQPMDYNLSTSGVRGTYRIAYSDASARRGALTRFVYLGRYTCD